MADATPLRLGVAGLGRAFSVMLPTLTRHPAVRLVAAADTRTEARKRFAGEFSAKAYDTVAALCAEGQSSIGNIGQIDRGYERIDERLQGLGAGIERADL